MIINHEECNEGRQTYMPHHSTSRVTHTHDSRHASAVYVYVICTNVQSASSFLFFPSIFTMAVQRRQQSDRCRQLVPCLTFGSSLAFLLAFHVRADDESERPSLWRRVAQGPDGLETLDKVLFGVVILLAFELLDFITKNYGSMCMLLSLPSPF